MSGTVAASESGRNAAAARPDRHCLKHVPLAERHIAARPHAMINECRTIVFSRFPGTPTEHTGRAIDVTTLYSPPANCVLPPEARQGTGSRWLHRGSYRPQPRLRKNIPKGNGKTRVKWLLLMANVVVHKPDSTEVNSVAEAFVGTIPPGSVRRNDVPRSPLESCISADSVG